MAAFARILLALLCALTAFAQEGRDAAQRTAIRSFYTTVLAFQESGIPSKRDTRRLKHLASRDLLQLLEEARKVEDLYAWKTRDAAPPLVESRLFFSLFEGATSLLGTTAEADGTHLAELVYDDGKTPVRWKDRVHLIREGRRWVIDDIEFLGEWAFGDKGRLRDNLRAVIETAEETPQD